MKNKNNLALAIFLVILTAVVVVSPALLDGIAFKASVGQKSYLTYEIKTKKPITSRQIIEAFYGSKIPEGNVGDSSDENSDQENSEALLRLLDKIFSDDRITLGYMKSKVTPKMMFSRSVILEMVDNSPEVLNILTYNFFEQFEGIDITFETKTDTLLSFYYVNKAEASYAFDTEKIRNLLMGYAENNMNLSPQEYGLDFSEDYVYFTVLYNTELDDSEINN